MLSVCYSCSILIKLELAHQIFKKNIQIPNFMKICPVGAIQTDINKLTVSFHNSANAP